MDVVEPITRPAGGRIRWLDRSGDCTKAQRVRLCGIAPPSARHAGGGRPLAKMKEIIGKKKVRCIQVRDGTPCDGRSPRTTATVSSRNASWTERISRWKWCAAARKSPPDTIDATARNEFRPAHEARVGQATGWIERGEIHQPCGHHLRASLEGLINTTTDCATRRANHAWARSIPRSENIPVFASPNQR
jgi:hypothetical protein